MVGRRRLAEHRELAVVVGEPAGLDDDTVARVFRTNAAELFHFSDEVLTTPVWDSFAAFCREQGLEEDAVKRLFREDLRLDGRVLQFQQPLRERQLGDRRDLALLRASSPKFFVAATQADFLKGDLENLSVDARGQLLVRLGDLCENTLEALDGTRLSSEQLRGKPVVLNF